MTSTEVLSEARQRHLNKHLIDACRENNLNDVLMWLDKGAHVHARDMRPSSAIVQGFGRSALHCAASVLQPNQASEALVHALIERGADVHGLDDQKNTPLHLAARHDCVGMIQALLVHGSEPNARNEHGQTPLHVAVGRGNRAVCLSLIKAGSEINAQNLTGQTALHAAACFTDSTDLLVMLLQHGASVHVSNQLGRTPLHLSVMEGETRGLACLLKEGAAVNARDAQGLTPLEHLAAIKPSHGERRFDWRMLVLIAHGADTSGLSPDDHPNLYGMPPLHAAILIRSVERMVHLLNQGASCDETQRGHSAHDFAKGTEMMPILQAWEARRAIERAFEQPVLEWEGPMNPESEET